MTKKTGFLSNLGTPTFIDLKSGITVGVIIIPQAMAYATLAGLPAQHGLYAAFIPVLLYGLFGSSRYLSVGPAALDSMLVAAFLLSLKLTTLADYIQSAILLTFMVGIIQFLLGILKMGFIIQFFFQTRNQWFYKCCCFAHWGKSIGSPFGTSVLAHAR